MTLCRVVKLVETQTPAGQLIKIRSLNLGPITTQIGETEIICHDQNNVRSFIRRKRARMTNQENENAEKQTHDGDQHRLKDLLGTVTEQNKNMETHVPRQTD